MIMILLISIVNQLFEKFLSFMLGNLSLFDLTDGRSCYKYNFISPQMSRPYFWSKLSIVRTNLLIPFVKLLRRKQSSILIKVDHGGFQLEFVNISQVINHMTCYNSSALIGCHYSIKTEEQILYRIFFEK